MSSAFGRQADLFSNAQAKKLFGVRERARERGWKAGGDKPAAKAFSLV
jgi:hypothetical protein